MSKIVKTLDDNYYSLECNIDPVTISDRLRGDPSKTVWINNVRIHQPSSSNRYGNITVEEIVPLAIKHISGRLLMVWRDE